jgi:asparagine synthase (glutamine-hydrolysing)
MSAPRRAEFHGIIARPGTPQPPSAWDDAFAAGAAPADVHAPCVTCAAGWQWSGPESGIAARRPPLLWDPQALQTLPWSDARAAELVAALLAGALTAAGDDLLLLWTRDRCVLRSSGSGGSVVYWHEVPGGWAFAQAIPLLQRGRVAPLDQTGIAEVARFGANYTSRTILQGIGRLPIAHELEVSAAGAATRPWASFYITPQTVDDGDAMDAVESRLRQLLEQLPEQRHLMFSGGVDSSLLGMLLVGQHGSTRAVNLGMGADDPEADHARRVAAEIGLEFTAGRLALSVDELLRIVAGYASPTLDFSILPTFMVGALARADGATTIVDGTGGDAWFGFGALANEPVWRHVHLAWPLRVAAAHAYGTLARYRDGAALGPLKAIARAPSRGDPALAHLCASPLYDVIWRLDPEAWRDAEAEVSGTLDRLLAQRPQSGWQRMAVADAAFIASGAFAAKSGQWSLARDVQTVYPFLTPGLVDVARRLPLEMLLRNGTAKPLLKELAVRLGIPRDRIYRRKAGFQPPLAALMRQADVRAFTEECLGTADETDGLMTADARRLMGCVLAAAYRPTIHTLYPFWNVFSMRVWLRALRSGDAARQWCT